MKTKIFISYNPKNELEQNTANRIQVLCSLYNVTICLPNRLKNKNLKESTKKKIENSKFYILFSVEKISKTVLNELEYANKLGKRIFILQKEYNIKKAIILKTQYNNIMIFKLDLKKFFNNIFVEIQKEKENIINSEINEKDYSILIAIITLGVSLLILKFLKGIKNN